MILKYLLKPLGTDSVPIGHKKQIGAAALIAGSGLLGSIIGSRSQSSANSTNLQLTRENNETQKLLTRETNAMQQQQFNENMKWLRAQYYDTEQMRRAVESYRKAGLNPALAYGAPNTVGSVGAPSQSQFHVAQTEAGHVDPVNFGDGLSESVGHSVDAYMNNQLINAQTENIKQEGISKRIQNFTQFARDVANLRSTYADIELKLKQKDVSEATRKKLEVEKEQLDNQIKLFWTQFDALSEAPKKSNRLIDAQYDDTMANVALKKIEARFKPALLQAGIKVSQSQAAQLEAMAGNLWESAKSEYFNRHNIMPLEVIQRKLANGISSIVFNRSKNYEDFLKDNEFEDWRSFIKLFSGFLFKLQPK